MKIYNLKCPNCGATLSTDVKNNYAKCDYCGNEFVISDDMETEAKQPDRNGDKSAAKNKAGTKPKHTSGSEISAKNTEINKKSRSRDLIIIALFALIGLILNFCLDKEGPQDIVPRTDLHRFFMELRPDCTPQNVETLAQKHKLHFFRTEKAVNATEADTIYYKIAKTNETVLDKKGEHGETVEIEFDAVKNNAFKLAVYADPEHITGRAVLLRYGSYYSLSSEEHKTKNSASYYYYNNSLRSTPGEQKTHPPYLKCTDAVEALKYIYTYKK